MAPIKLVPTIFLVSPIGFSKAYTALFSRICLNNSLVICKAAVRFGTASKNYSSMIVIRVYSLHAHVQDITHLITPFITSRHRNIIYENDERFASWRTISTAHPFFKVRLSMQRTRVKYRDVAVI